MRFVYIIFSLLFSFTLSFETHSLGLAYRKSGGNSNACTGVLLDSNIVNGKLTNLGPQVTMATIQSGAFLKDKSGQELVYTVVRGKPAHLVGYELKTNTLVVDLPLDNMDGAWGTTVASDGSFYAGGGGGHLYRYVPGDAKPEDLGKALGTETYIWDLVAGENGEIFGASYPGCRIFRYHPEDGFSDVGKGPIVENENYVRSLAYDKETRKIYAGIASHAHLVELDLASGKKREMLPEKFKDQEAVYDLRLIKGLDGGDRLLATVTNIGKTLVYNIKTDNIEHELDQINVRGTIKSPRGLLYYGSGSDLMSWKLSEAGNVPEKKFKAGAILAMKWSTDNELYVFNRYADLIRYNTSTGKSETVKLKIPPQPISINATALGADGRIWTGGYLTGSNAAYDPISGISTQYRGLSQTEGVTLQGEKMYFGIYPHGRLFVYDTSKPWNPGDMNPKMIGKIPGQSRFYAGESVPDHNKMFFGSVPEYGKLGGSLVDYDTQTQKLETHTNVVLNQSVVSLTYASGMLIGGTSVWGGLGIQPSEQEAVLFGWDPKGKRKTFEFVPVDNAKAITYLLNGPDGNVWGIADGNLFIFNPATQKVISRHLVYEVSEERKKSTVWHDVSMVIHPSGKIYGTGSGQLFKIDPNTMQITTVLKPASRLSMDQSGRIYFSRGTDLWQYIPAD